MADLDADDLATREAARTELDRLGAAAYPALRTALADQPPLDQKVRIDALLAKPRNLIGSGAGRREWRAVEVLERIGTPAAREMLRSMLKTKLDAPLEAAIKASLERLGEAS